MEAERSGERGPRVSPLVVGVGAVVVLIVVVVALVVSRAGSDHRSDRDANPGDGSTAPIADTVTCSAWHRPNDRVAPTADGELVVDMNIAGQDQTQSLEAGDFRLATTFTWDEAFSGEGRSLSVSVSELSGPPIVSHLYQIWSGPIDQFAGDHGFTGLVYVTSPTTGAELQYLCKAS